MTMHFMIINRNLTIAVEVVCSCGMEKGYVGCPYLAINLLCDCPCFFPFPWDVFVLGADLFYSQVQGNI